MTINEVARELGITTDEVQSLIDNDWLHAKAGKPGELLIQKDELRQFKDYAIADGMKLRFHILHWRKPISRADYADAARLLEKVDEKNAPAEIKRTAQEVFARHGIKNGAKK